MQTEQFSVWLPASDSAALTRMAELLGVKRSVVMRWIARRAVVQFEETGELPEPQALPRLTQEVAS